MSFLSAQPATNEYTTIVPPSAEAATLGKYLDVPTTNHTGAVSIPIPLYQATSNQIKLPITLSYHAGGIRVEELASWVGTGWTLSAGGLVSRTIKGIPDEGAGGYLSIASQLNINDPQCYSDVINRIKDSESDIYAFNAPGISGKFFFDENGDVQLVPRQDVKIEFAQTGNSFASFTVIDPSGKRYIFGLYNGTSAYGSSNVVSLFPQSHTTEWMLMRIESFDGSSFINYEYDREEYNTKITPGRFLFEASNGNTSSVDPSSTQNVDTWRLSRITTQSEVIDFMANTKREDLESFGTTEARRLDAIKITTGGYEMEWEFSYDYFLSGTGGGLEEEDKRLRLTSIQKKAFDNSTSVPPYQFDYQKLNNEYFLPNRLSKSRDYWGYYNGKANASFDLNIPSLTVGGYSCGSLCGADRSTDATVMDVGILTEVTYPTGGTMTLEYEANRFKPDMGCPVPPILSTTTQFTGMQEQTCSNPFGAGDCCGVNTENLIVNFSNINDIIFGHAEILAMKDLGDNTGGCNMPINAEAKLEILDQSNTVISTTLLSLNDDIATAQSDPNFPNVVVMDEVDLPFNMFDMQPNQNYTFRISSENAFGRVRIMETVAIPDAPNDEFFVGGLRIKQITQDKGDNIDNIVTTYSYGEGSLFEEYPRFTSFISTTFQCTVPVSNCSGGQSDEYVTGTYFYENSLVALSDASGEHVGYEEVIIKTGTSNGSTVKTYNLEFDTDPFFIPPNASNYPGNEPQINRAEGGILLETNLFPEGSSSVVSSAVETFNLNDAYSSFGATSWSTVVLSTSNGLQSVFTYPYEHRTKPVLKQTSVQTLDGVSTTTTFGYDAMDRFVAPVSQEMTNSDGKVYKTEMIYPHDVAGTPYSSMVTQNRIMPVETQQFEDATLIDGIRTSYSFIDGMGVPTGAVTANGPYPSSFERYELTWPLFGPPSIGSWVHQLTIDQYDFTTRRPSEITQDGWQKQTYGYNGTGMLTSQSFQNYTSTYSYFGNSTLLQTMTNIDGTSMSYTYDELFRLKTGTDNDRNVVTTYDYFYGNPTNGGNNIAASIDFPMIANSELDLIENISFFDGLGRVFQTNKKKQGSTATEDVVISMTYDEIGRLEHTLEPISSMGNGAFVQINLTLPKTTTSYYSDPLNREESVTDPEGFVTQFEYGSNTAGQFTGYGANELNLSTIIDADMKFTQSFKDKKGRSVGSIAGEIGQPNSLTTQYEFDGKDRVTKITPPGASGTPSLTYLYEYYGNDLIKQKIFPDQASIEYRYNNRDLMTAYQDGNLRDDGQWVGYNYDVYGRNTKMGFITTPNTNNSATGPSIAAADVLIENTYSPNTTGILTGKLTSETCQTLDINGVTGTFLTKNFEYEATIGRLQRIKANTLLNSALDNEITTLNYDAADNVTIEAFSNTVAGVPLSIDKRMTYDFAGRSKEIFHDLNGIGEEQIAKQTYTTKDQLETLDLGDGLQLLNYSYMDNQWLDKINDPLGAGSDLFHLDLLYDENITGITGPNAKNGNISNIIHQVKGKDRMAAGYTYDSFNRLLASRTGYMNGGGAIYDTDHFSTNYTYDDRGNILFLDRQGQAIQNDSYINGLMDDFTYTYYAGTNRLQEVSVATTSIANNGGNEGNQGATSDQFLYDSNGNIIRHPLKKLNLEYNFINLPTTTYYANGDKLDWIYTPQGEKLQQTVTRNGAIEETRYYCAGNEYVDTDLVQVNHEHGRVARKEDCKQIQYVSGIHQDNDDISGRLIISEAHIPQNISVEYHAPDKVVVPETFTAGLNGQLTIDTVCNEGDWQYEYVIRDHLGNTRLLFADEDGNGSIDEDTEILAENHYYPFGMELKGEWEMRKKFDFDYSYNGKELISDLNLNLHDYGARYHDPVIARWTTIDPMMESYYPISSYSYVANNPLLFSDPDGQKIIIGHKDADGNITSVIYGEDGKLYINDEEKAEYTGDNTYVLAAKEAIDNLLKIDGVKDVISDLITTPAIHGVQNFDAHRDGTPSETKYSQNYRRRGGGSTTKFMPDNDRARWNGRNKDFSDEEILGHELKHGYNKEHKMTNFARSNHSKVSYEEIDATSFQNAIRIADNRSARTSYGRKDISKDLLEYGKYKTKKIK